MAEAATGIVISELPEDLDLEGLKDFGGIDEGSFVEWIDQPGKYIAELMSVKTQDNGGKTPSENLMLKITVGEHAGQCYMERVYHGYKALKRACAIGKRLKVWTEEQNQELIEAIEAGNCVNGPDFSGAIGKEFVIELRKDVDKQTGKESIKMSFVGIWGVDHKDVVGFVEKARGAGGTPKATPAAATAASASTNGNGKHKAEPVKAEPAKAGKAGAASTIAGKAATRAATKPAATVDEL